MTTPQSPGSPSLAERLERLVDGDAELTAELSLIAVLQRVADLARDVVGCRYAAVATLNPDGRTLESFTTSGVTAEDRERIGALPRGHGILGLLIREGRVVRLPEIGQHPESVGFPPNHPPMKSFLGVPILTRQGILGDLYVTEKIGAAEFSEEDEHIAVLLAAKAAAAIENARLHEESARLLEEVHHLHRSRERFFAMVNHELRNSLAAVYGWAEMLVRKKDPHTVPRAAFEVLESAENAMGLISDLLDLSRLDEDRLKPNLRDVDCTRVARSAVRRVTPAAEAKHIKLEVVAPSSFPPCRTDASRVEQILVNLLTNAIRHSPPNGRVRVVLGQEATGRVITVEDEGPGVAEADAERIFEMYMTEAGTESGGTGVGLPLSRRLARLLGGNLRVIPSPNKGARFQLDLPG
jgi:signal transduction histidine kinase